MKRYTHPVIESSLIQTKDGSTYTKNWLFFRAAVALETDSKNWSGDNSINISHPTIKQSQSNASSNRVAKSSRKGRSLFVN